MDISETLKELREDSGLTQKELAERLQISQSAVSAYEKNGREPVARILSIYADFFQVTTDYLLGREDDFGNVVVKSSAGNFNKLNPDENEILKKFRTLNDAQKNAVKILLDSFTKSKKSNEKQKHA